MNVLEVLSPFLTDRRKARMDQILSKRTRNLLLVLEDIYDPHNMSACLRTAEALGVQEVHVVEDRTPFKPCKKVSIGADKWLEVKKHKGAAHCVAELKARGFNVCVGALRDDAVSLTDLDFSRPTALVFGNEHDGISQELLDLSDQVFVIPMEGFTQSFNISVSAAISLFYAVQERIRRLGKSGDLDPEDIEELRAKWYTRSVPMAAEILARAMEDEGSADKV